MRQIFGSLVAFVFALVTLAACSPSADKPSSAQPSASRLVTAPATSAPAATDKPAQQTPAPQTPAPSAASGAPGGGQYSTLATAQPAAAGSKIEVLEFFGYFCNHCHALEPMLGAWEKKQGNRVVLKRIPVRQDEAKLYFALEAMGKLEALHGKIFHAVQVERKRLNSDSAAAEFVAQHGVDKKAFLEHYASFSVQSKVMNAASVTKAYQVDGVPMIAIDGRFITSASHAATRPGVEQTEAGMHAAMLQVMDELVAKARQERGLAGKSAK